MLFHLGIYHLVVCICRGAPERSPRSRIPRVESDLDFLELFESEEAGTARGAVADKLDHVVAPEKLLLEQFSKWSTELDLESRRGMTAAIRDGALTTFVMEGAVLHAYSELKPGGNPAPATKSNLFVAVDSPARNKGVFLQSASEQSPSEPGNRPTDAISSWVVALEGGLSLNGIAAAGVITCALRFLACDPGDCEELTSPRVAARLPVPPTCVV